MKFNNKFGKGLLFILAFILLYSFPALGDAEEKEDPAAKREQQLLEVMHSFSSHQIFDYVKELSHDKFAGRLTGTEEYNASAKWLVDHLVKWGVKPAGDNNTYYQDFKNPYTIVKPGSEIILHIPYKKGSRINKSYDYQVEYFPGSTSGSGELTAQVVYVGYGISAPELGYDEYKGLNVKGKIVLVEREVPLSPDKDPETFKKWRPYSYHQYKIKNARKHGAAGMIYNYHIANPNAPYIEDLLLTYVGKAVMKDIFTGTGKTHKATVEKIKKTLKPQSFKTGKLMTLKNYTEHHPNGIGRNVLGMIEGTDPALKDKVIILSAHLDHLGWNHEIMPGANDNASGVAVIMAVAQALAQSPVKPAATVVFAFFGAEEQGVRGSEIFLERPTFPKEKIYACLNLDGVGRGSKIFALAAKNYPNLWKPLAEANRAYIHREIRAVKFDNLARPRLDAAHFMWAGIPTVSFGVYGAKAFPYPTYHTTYDNPEIITPEIMEDLAQLLFMGIMNIK